MTKAGDRAPVHPIGREEVARLVGAGAALLDVMPPRDFAESHLPGAVNVRLAEIAQWASRQLSRNQPVITYCYDSL